jgi:Leucine-rich repeat (LRR) protein
LKRQRKEKDAHLKRKKLIALLRQDMEAAINGDGVLELYTKWPRGIPTQAESKRLSALEYDYTAKDLDEAFSAFDDDALGKIRRLHLKYLKLARLPERVRKLKNLRGLYLIETGISYFPTWFSELVNLKTLYLQVHYNVKRSIKLFDHLEPLLQLPALEALSLGDDHGYTATVPDIIGACTGLKKLSLTGTTLKALPEWVRNFRGLTELGLYGPQYEKLPDWIGELTALERLTVCDSDIRELPASIGNLVGLKGLVLDSNDVPMLPDTFGKLVKLEEFSMMGLGRSGDRDLKALPDWIGNLGALKFLSLVHTDVTCLPDSMANCASLEYLELAMTSIAVLPPWMESLTALKYLGIAHTKITNIPECLLRREASGDLRIGRSD